MMMIQKRFVRSHNSKKDRSLFKACCLGCLCCLFMFGLFESKALGDGFVLGCAGRADSCGWYGLLLFPGYGESDKSPTEAQLKAGKGVGLIQWSERTGGPRDISGNLTPPSEEDPEIIAWRFLEEKKVLYGINDPHEDLRIRVRIDGKYDTTIHFKQIYQGVDVENVYLTVSILPNGVIHSVSGEYFPGVEIDIVPKLSAEEAFNTAKEHWEKYSNHDSAEEYVVQHALAASIAELVIYLTAKRSYLIWRFYKIIDWYFLIDAYSGVIREAYFSAPGQDGHLQPPMPQGDIEVSSRSLNFEIDSTGDYQTKEVVISNTGESPLVIKDIVLQGESFTIEEPYLSLPLPIASGSEAIMAIGFPPSDEGEFKGKLSIESTDKDNPVVEIFLSGNKTPAHTASQEERYDFNYYNLSPYNWGIWLSPFFYGLTSAGFKQDYFSPAQDYLFPWSSFYYPLKNLPYTYLYPPLDYSFNYYFYPTLED